MNLLKSNNTIKILCILFIIILTLTKIVPFIKRDIMPLIESGGLAMKIQMFMQPTQIPINDNRILFLEKYGNGAIIIGDDWTHTETTVYYDGVVRFEKFFSMSGKVCDERWLINEPELSQLKNILATDFKESKSQHTAVVGPEYHFAYFDENGNLIHATGNMAIYKNNCLEKIETLISKSHNN